MKTAWNRSELTYCTNVHPGENLEQVYKIINGSLSSVRKNRNLNIMSAGLWLSNHTAQALSSEKKLQQFACQLEQNGITLFTLNGFPAQGFHSRRVKEAVYHPDWSEPERLDYTVKLAHILSALLPPDISEGTISTVPLGFGPDWGAKKNKLALNALCQCIIELDKINQKSKRQIRLCLEMEPGCVLESTNTLINFFTSELVKHAAALNIDFALIKRHLGICFDVCHQAVMFEDTYNALQKIHDAGITIGKIQISSALELRTPDDDSARTILAGFVEEKYLHQSCCKIENGRILKVLDLDRVFIRFPETYPWRIHFHVPVQAETLLCEGLGTTQYEIGRTLDFLHDNPDLHPHIEVETYTWTALPEQIRPKGEKAMVNGLTEELVWLEKQMHLRGLLLKEERVQSS